MTKKKTKNANVFQAYIQARKQIQTQISVLQTEYNNLDAQIEALQDRRNEVSDEIDELEMFIEDNKTG